MAKFNLKERIEKNPIIALFTLSVILVSGAISVLQYFHNKEMNLLDRQKDIEITDLKSKLSSIKRGISSNEYFDIRQLFVKNEDIKAIPTSLSFFSEDQFYALKEVGSLKYSKPSYVDLFKINEGKEPPDLYKSLYSNKYVHLWTTEDEVRIENIEGLKLISPRIKLQKTSKDELRGMFGELFHKLNLSKMVDSYVEKNKLSDGSFDKSSIEKNLENIYNGNWSAILLDQYLTQCLSLPAYNPNMSFELLNVNKVGNVIYTQGLATFTDVTVNNKYYKRYYLRDEVIILTSSTAVYIISTLVPSSDPSTRDPVYNDISNWLHSFKMIIGE